MRDRREEIVNKIKLEKWSCPISEVLAELDECVKIEFKHYSSTSYLSKIGGSPDLAIGVDWPLEEVRKTKWKLFGGRSEQVTFRPYSFIAQIDLRELSELDLNDNFPNSGLLYFFYSQDQSSPGDKARDYGKWKVFYDNIDPNNTYEAKVPEELPRSSLFAQQRINLFLGFTLSKYGNRYLYADLPKDENILLSDLVEGEYVNQMLGPPYELEGNQKALVSWVTEDIDEFEGLKDDWLLLLQIDSIEECNMNWGDVGNLNFWINAADLENRRFDRVWCVMQSY